MKKTKEEILSSINGLGTQDPKSSKEPTLFVTIVSFLIAHTILISTIYLLWNFVVIQNTNLFHIDFLKCTSIYIIFRILVKHTPKN